jgi:hypothetical protein
MRNQYFEWLAKVCILMGQPIAYGATLIEDQDWFGCFDDGMTPEEAFNEAKEKKIIFSKNNIYETINVTETI